MVSLPSFRSTGRIAERSTLGRARRIYEGKRLQTISGRAFSSFTSEVIAEDDHDHDSGYDADSERDQRCAVTGGRCCTVNIMAASHA
jgi:hypothetical protein